MVYIITESQLYGSSNFMLGVVSVFSVLLGIYVIISKNPVISILFLIGLFFSVSLYLIIIGLHFLGLSYLLVYIGAVSIFFIFIIMLINIRVSELLTDNRNSIPLAVLTVLLFNYFLSDILPFSLFIYDLKINNVLTLINVIFFNIFPTNYIGSDDSMYSLDSINDMSIASVTSKSWDGIIVSMSHISSIGSVLYTNLYILMVVISLILLLAMVGAIVITIG